jgi:hypothetical protein
LAVGRYLALSDQRLAPFASMIRIGSTVLGADNSGRRWMIVAFCGDRGKTLSVRGSLGKGTPVLTSGDIS